MLVVAAALLAALGFQPVIEAVPVSPAGGALEIIGQGFGARQGASSVLLQFDDAPAAQAEIASWSRERIVATLPASAGSGAVQVVRSTLLGEQRSEWIPFVVQAADLPSQPFADAAVNLASVALRIPAGTALPGALQAIVLADVFPLHAELLTNSR